MSHGNGSMHSMFAEGLVYYTLFFPEDRGQRTEDRGQRTEDRGQRTEDRGFQQGPKGPSSPPQERERGLIQVAYY